MDTRLSMSRQRFISIHNTDLDCAMRLAQKLKQTIIEFGTSLPHDDNPETRPDGVAAVLGLMATAAEYILDAAPYPLEAASEAAATLVDIVEYTVAEGNEVAQ
jgi:hypothetical protein